MVSIAGFAHAAVARSAVATPTLPIPSERASKVNGIACAVYETADNAITASILFDRLMHLYSRYDFPI